MFLTLGITLAYGLKIHFTLSFFGVLSGFLLLSVFYFIPKRQFQNRIWFGFAAYISMIGLGIFTYTIHDQKNSSKHYSKVSDLKKGTANAITFKIRERLKPSAYYDKYIIDLIKVDDESVIGKSLLNIKKDTIQNNYNIDDVLLIYSEFKIIPNLLNPNQFNYKAYLEKQYIYHQLVVDEHSILTLRSQQNSLFGYAERFRQKINRKLKTYSFKSDELSIINALLLGQRQDMDQSVYNSYANAGAIHILAVSGLHVGIILFILNVILKPIEHIKHGRTIKITSILLLLWSFAIIAGLSASVTRAVTMFSVVAIAINLKRTTNIYNTLAISVFILLLFKPMFLFDVGFQMSYLAVLSIVSIQPLIYKLWRPKWRITNYFWQILTVTIAAQMGVVPISLYYFHQFPGLFFVSNLAIIPFLGLILGFGIIVIVLALFDILPSAIADTYGTIIGGMNDLVSWVSEQEQFLFRNISFELPQLISCYLLVLAFTLLWKAPNYKRLMFLLISLLLTQGAWFYSTNKNSKNTFVIFHKSRYTMISQQSNSTLRVYDNLDSIATLNDKVITNYDIGHFITSIERDSLQSVYQFQNKTILVIDSLGVYNVKRFQPDYVLLRNSPQINMERLIDSIQPQLIIADGSNYKSYVNRWKATCTKRKLPFHHTGEKGAFILNK
ncbi:ComEC/Rec2 family competence protein [uncultured Psychroserpens sp.]|uniref:ComEC/Rec2 family competence protein n=1 Tax=uncultured Psychroserpens sp. TaxID=255436 RepID=UPI0026340A6D|nr:ComEC/Rec2 family competence protein [uncultured Psychroserpens sp.]